MLGEGKKPADEADLPMGWAQSNARNQTGGNEPKQSALSTDCVRGREKSRLLTKPGFAASELQRENKAPFVMNGLWPRGEKPP